MSDNKDSGSGCVGGFIVMVAGGVLVYLTYLHGEDYRETKRRVLALEKVVIEQHQPKGATR